MDPNTRQGSGKLGYIVWYYYYSMVHKKNKRMTNQKRKNIVIGSISSIIGLLVIGVLIQTYPNLVKTQTAFKPNAPASPNGGFSSQPNGVFPATSTVQLTTSGGTPLSSLPLCSVYIPYPAGATPAQTAQTNVNKCKEVLSLPQRTLPMSYYITADWGTVPSPLPHIPVAGDESTLSGITYRVLYTGYGDCKKMVGGAEVHRVLVCALWSEI